MSLHRVSQSSANRPVWRCIRLWRLSQWTWRSAPLPSSHPPPSSPDCVSTHKIYHRWKTTIISSILHRKNPDKFDQINLKFLQGSWETMFIAHEPVMDQQLFSKKINAFNMSKPKIQRQKEISRGVTDRLSERSVLFPTNMISTSPPRSVLTSSIHFDVWWNEFASELQGNKYDINRWPTNRYHKIPVLKQLLFCMDCKQCNQHTINQHLTIKSIKLRKGQGRNFSNAHT